MAANLVRAGFAVSGFNRTAYRPSAVAAAEKGVQVLHSAHDAVVDAEVVFLCLSDVPDIHEMLFGTTGIAGSIKPGSLVVDMSTTGPGCARELHDRLKKLGLQFLDAPVTGGDIGARDGTLTIMVGGDREDFEMCHSRFEAMGKKIWHCGPAGSGQALKLCNQILCAVNLLAVCEAFELAGNLQIDPQLVVDVCQSGAAGSWSLANLGARILKSDFAPGFKIKDMLKDLRLVEESLDEDDRSARAALDERLPATSLAVQRLQYSSGDSGGGDRGTQAMIWSYRDRQKTGAQ